LNASTGAITGKPTKAGTFNFSVTASNSGGTSAAKALTITVSAPAPVISTTSLPGTTVGAAYTATLAASNSPTKFTLTSGSLPNGLTLNASTGAITGKPTTAGTFKFSVTASNSGGTSAAKALTITVSTPVPVISTTSLPGATVGEAYTATLAASNSPTKFTLTSGSLPNGLTLNASTGAITGKPTKAGTFKFSVTASNSGGTSAAKALTITVSVAQVQVPVISTTSLPNATVGAAYTATLAASNSPTKFALTGGSLPSGLTLNASTGAITGKPTKAGLFIFSVTASNSGGTSAGKALMITVSAAKLR
jgi:hypothetical protein